MSALRAPKSAVTSSLTTFRRQTPRRRNTLCLTDYSPDLGRTAQQTHGSIAAREAGPFSVFMSFLLLAATITSIWCVHASMPSTHPPVALMVLPVVAAGLLYGRACGLGVLFAGLFGARTIFYTHGMGVGFDNMDDAISFASIAVAMIGSSIVALYANAGVRTVAQTEAQCRSVNRDVLLAVTSGRLVLCTEAEIDEIATGVVVCTYPVAKSCDLQHIRQGILDATKVYIDDSRLADMVTCVTEASTNAIKHAGGGVVETRLSTTMVSVVVSDQGGGIDPMLLARATLESGFSTQNTLGMGFTLMLNMADKIALHTGPQGTHVAVQFGRR